MRARRGSAPGPRWGLHAGGCPPPVPPGPLLKKAGENLLENFSGFATDYAGPPLIGSGGLVWFAGRQGGKGWWMDRLDGGKSQRSRGGGGRAQRAQRRSGGLWPPPLRWFCGPSGPAKRRRPPGDPPGRPVGGGGVQGPGPLALAPEHARCRAQPGSGRVGFAHPPPPRPLEFPPTPKRQRKSQAPRSMGPGCLNDPRKGQGNGPAPLGKAAAHALRAAAA